MKRVSQTEYQNNRTKEKKLLGICPRCGGINISNTLYCSSCKIKAKEKRKADKEKREKLGICIECGHTPPPLGGKICSLCLSKAKIRSVNWLTNSIKGSEYIGKIKLRNRIDRMLVLQHYGNECECCKEKLERFLSIDHINSDGAKHREQSGVGGSLYKWLIKNNFPQGFRTLCHNCNLGRHLNGGICPHKEVSK